jgi:cysteinyl-tRNA synthetase
MSITLYNTLTRKKEPFTPIDPAWLARVDELIKARIEARKAKNFAESDRIRDELVAMGVQLKDGKDADGNLTTEWK